MTGVLITTGLIVGFVVAIFGHAFRHDIADWWTRRNSVGWEVGTYQPGTYREYTHIIPTRDGDHYQSSDGDCQCNPTAYEYESSVGHQSTFYVHRIMASHDERRAR